MKVFSNDTHITVIGSMEPDICTKMLRNLSKKFSKISSAATTREWFRVQSGVNQGCTMSGFLFLLSIDWVVYWITEGRRTGIRWKLASVLEDLDFADDIALSSSRNVAIKDTTSRLVD